MCDSEDHTMGIYKLNYIALPRTSLIFILAFYKTSFLVELS